MLFFARINMLCLLWLSFIGIGLANFFGEEHIRRTDQLILCSKNGKEPLYLAKMAAGITFGIAGTVLMPVRYGLASQLYNFMPMQFFSDTAFMDKRLFCIFGKYFTGLQAAPVFYLVSAVILVGIGYKVYKGYQVSGR